jgi:pyruvate,water dikinase
MRRWFSLRQGERPDLRDVQLPEHQMADAFSRSSTATRSGNDLQLVPGLDRVRGSWKPLPAAGEERRGEGHIAGHPAERAGKPIGICGQAPSDFPDFAAWLVEQGINSISLNPDSVIQTVSRIAEAEKSLASKGGGAGAKSSRG